MQSGYVIAIDGPDGVGKTTQLELLKKHFEQQGKTVHVTRASGGTPIGEALRNVSKSHNHRPGETDVFISLAMFSALAEDLQKRDMSGQIILIDRSPLAMVAYNAYGGELSDASTDKLRPGKQNVLEACVDTFKAWGVDLLIFLDAPQDVLDARLEKRAGHIDYFETQDPAYHHRVRDGYHAALDYLRTITDFKTRVVTTDASPNIQALSQHITKVADKHLDQPNS